MNWRLMFLLLGNGGDGQGDHNVDLMLDLDCSPSSPRPSQASEVMRRKDSQALAMTKARLMGEQLGSSSSQDINSGQSEENTAASCVTADICAVSIERFHWADKNVMSVVSKMSLQMT